jgi:predicted enzyme related to lactoylglutathione lyase
MGQPVVHFEIIGRNPDELQSFYGGLFAWEFDTSAPVADAVSEPSRYGFTVNKSPEGSGFPAALAAAQPSAVASSFTSASPTSKPRWRRPSDLVESV